MPSTRESTKDPLGEEGPNAGDPVISVVAVSPVTRFPDIAGIRTERLAIHRKSRWADADGDCNADVCGWARVKWGRNSQERNREDQRTDQIGDTHITHLSGVGWVCGLSVRPFAICGRALIKTQEHEIVVLNLQN